MLAMAGSPLRFSVAQSNLALGYYNFTPEIPHLLNIPQLGAKHVRNTFSLCFAPYGYSRTHRTFLMSTSNGFALTLIKSRHSRLSCLFDLTTTGSLAWTYRRVEVEGEVDRRILPRMRVVYHNRTEAFFRWRKDGHGGLTLSAVNSPLPFATYAPPAWPNRNGTLYFYPCRMASLTREDMALFIMFLALTMTTSVCFPVATPCVSAQPPAACVKDPMKL